jgi:hypothetical protein
MSSAPECQLALFLQMFRTPFVKPTLVEREGILPGPGSIALQDALIAFLANKPGVLPCPVTSAGCVFTLTDESSVLE